MWIPWFDSRYMWISRLISKNLIRLFGKDQSVYTDKKEKKKSKKKKLEKNVSNSQTQLLVHSSNVLVHVWRVRRRVAAVVALKFVRLGMVASYIVGAHVTGERSRAGERLSTQRTVVSRAKRGHFLSCKFKQKGYQMSAGYSS